MYDDHYGLNGRPFQLTPDPRFWFDTATHRKAMAYLGYGLSQGEGFIVITGDVGAGKTTLVGHLMATIDRDRLQAIKLVSTQIEADDLLRMVANGLGLDTAGMTKAQLLVAIERGLHATARSGRRTLLIVDEAQALPVSALEELRMLSNFQAGGHALLQIFLLGQPEFRERLHGSERLEQLRQRVIATHHLDPMEREEVAAYMTHRLTVVGWNGRPHFTDDAYAALYAGSDGVPRRLNQLAGRVLLCGAIEQLDTIDGHVVEQVIADIAGDSPEPVAKPEPLRIVKPLDSAEARPIRRESVTAAPVVAAAPDPALLARIATLESRVEESAQPTAPDQTLMQQLAAIESRLENVSAGPRVDRGIVARLASLEARVEQAPKPDPALAGRIASVEGAVAEVDQAFRDEVAALGAMIDLTAARIPHVDPVSKDELATRLAALDERITQSIAQLGARKPETDPAIKAHIASLETRLAQLASRAPEVAPEIDAHLASLETRFAQLAGRKAETDPAISAHIASIETRLANIANRAAEPSPELKAHIASLETRLDQVASRATQVDPAIADHIETLEAAMEQLAARPTDPNPALKARLASLETRVDEAFLVASEGDPAVKARIASLEARVEEQDAALRRVLTLLVDWVEGDQGGEVAAFRRDLR